MKREISFILIIFLILTLGMHYNEFLISPLLHIQNLSTAGAYGFDSFHPLIFTLLVYLILLIPRTIFKIIRKVKQKNN
ncbi:hypothetical protein CRV05_09330 [Halarcobacter bivalviorum]|uniref:Membrane protein n=1 Tax=Halarcobacter bivalviorum TaxID=663364 RepID=A0AAX2A8X7_9BACT|nr:putative membrane protein [Halarcobacter bivalviorum]RXK09503.1 hypothetical protein CRV05_09330 [Halarcobacter bivalviorum]